MVIAYSRSFGRCRRGNFTVLTALLAAPLLILLAGLADLHQSTRLKQVMQQSADAAVLAASRHITLSHKQLEQFANRHFHANLNGAADGTRITGRLFGHSDHRRFLLTFKAHAKNRGILSSSGSYSTGHIRVSARAELGRKPGSTPRLIGGTSGAISQKAKQ